jgi:hypothetical protein
MCPLNWLNPAAGEVAIPGDARELEAALRAGRISWRIFPYLAWRYGARGELFTRSDSAWLVTLSAAPPERIRQQIGWLGSVLSNRGMPRWLLERHLDVLVRQLVHAVPEKKESYEKLAAVAGELARERRACVPDEAFESLAEGLAAQVGFASSRLLRGTGRLLVASVADEKAGIKNAVARLTGWLTDPARFEPQAISQYALRYPEPWLGHAARLSEQWEHAVASTIERARKL